MCSVRDSDTSLWLHNKLGAAGEPWAGGSICPQLTQEVLRNVRDCFPDLHTHVKLKLLLSFLHLPRRNVDEWRNELEEIMEVASVDSELWVSMLSEILKTLPSTGSLNTHQLSELDEAKPVFGDMVTELKRLVNRHSELAMLPMECIYLNKTALTSVVGQQPSPVKHFTLKRKPKSAALRAELLQKSSDALSNVKKAVAPMVPVRSRGMPRKMTDTTPLKGLPSRWSIRGNNTISGMGRGIGIRPPVPTVPGRKDGGIKLLDIADQPATHTQKKRKRMLELEEAQKKAALEAEAGAVTPVATVSPTSSTPTPTAASSAATTGNQTLPEYARGLNNYVMPSTPATPTSQINRDQGSSVLANAASVVTPITPGVVQPQPSTPLAHTPKTPHIILPAQTVRTAGQDNSSTITTIPVGSNPLSSSKNPILIHQGPGSKPIIIGQQQKVLITGQHGQKPLIVTAGPGGAILSGQNILKGPSGMPVILTNSVLQHATQNSQGQAIIQGGKTVVLTNVKQMNPGVVQHGFTPQQGGNVIIQTQQVIASPNTPVQNSNPTSGTTADGAAKPQSNLLTRRGLTLTRDQMLAAQDMFKNANRVTRPEKALILGFMAGSRDNPCPNLGNIVTIKLSENQENVLQRDDTYLTMLCETHFQMNYNNGQWMRIKKYRPIEGATPQPNIPQHVS